MNLMVENTTQDKKWNNDKCQYECRKPCVAMVSDGIKHRTGEEDYVLDPSTCVCQCDKDCENGKL